jgi:hypothetical protein
VDVREIVAFALLGYQAPALRDSVLVTENRVQFMPQVLKGSLVS